MSVGKESSFTSLHWLPLNDENSRDLGNAKIAGIDLATEILKSRWGKLKEIRREPSEENSRRKELETEAKATGKGIWNRHGPKVGPSATVHSPRFPGTPVMENKCQETAKSTSYATMAAGIGFLCLVVVSRFLFGW